MYRVKEIFYTLQGEGARCGRPAVFCRFTGCNLWSGREIDRPHAICQFCDTDFRGTDGVNGGRYDEASLASLIESLWPEGHLDNRYVVFTGGEPLLQLDVPLLKAMHECGFEVAIETNGTIAVPDGVDWVCVSPKMGTELVVQSGDELKLVVPQNGQNLSDYEKLDFSYFFLQPLDGENRKENTKLAIDLCLKNPKWRLGVQMHKYLNIQ